MSVFDRFKKLNWECDFTTHPKHSPLVGVFMESRDIPEIDYVLKNFSCMFPYASLCIGHSVKNKDRIMRVLGPNPTNVMLFELPEPFERDECLALLTSEAHWRRFEAFDRVLTIHIDTGIRENTILKFMHYDYIGAHWEHQPIPGDPRVFQGNGGFSLRNPRIMAEICKEKCPIPSCEDVWIGWKFINSFPNSVLPENRAVCAQFSTEGEDFYGTLGFHDTLKYNPKAYKVYAVADGPTRKLFKLDSATLDGKDVTDLVRLGIGPNCLRIFNTIGKGKLVINGNLEYDLNSVSKIELYA